MILQAFVTIPQWFVGVGLRMEGCQESRREGRKTFSHGRSEFPTGRTGAGRSIDERAGELKAEQVISLSAVNAESTGPKGTRGPGQIGDSGQRRAGDFQQNLRGTRQSSPDGYQGPSGTDVESSGELEKVLALFVAAANEHGDGQWQACPLSAFFFEPVTNQRNAPEGRTYPCITAPIGPN
jgi:hypothetical protein